MTTHRPPTSEPLNPRQLERLGRAAWLGRAVRVYAETDSTNLRALGLNSAEAAHGLALLAESQTAGRGRLGRRWEAPRGKALLATFVLRGERYGRNPAALTMAAAIAVRRALAARSSAEIAIRWPNDLLLRDRKAAGILAEAGPWIDPPGWALGIGVNVNQRPEDFAPELRESATSLSAAAGGAPIDRAALFADLAWELEQALDRAASAEGREAIRAEWERHCLAIGRVLRIDLHGEIVEGTAVGLDSQGGLILRLPGGPLRTLLSGTVLKAAGE